METRTPARLVLIGAVLALLAGCGGGTTAPGTTVSPHPATTGTSAPQSPAPTQAPSSAQPSAPPPTRPAPPPAAPTKPASPPGTQVITGRLAGVDWTAIPTSRKVVALTFDAGANADAVASILATLSHTGVPATFFLTGDFVRDFPASARSIAAGGYRIGNHTISHPYLTQKSDAAVREEILGAARQITAVTGVNPVPLFRFPYGDVNARTIAIANSLGYVPVRWTVDTLGWKGISGGITTSTVISRVLGGLRPGEIVLMHVGSNPTDHSTLDAGALPRLITQLRARGYSFVTLSALVG
jgi:peptidoglycan/xylan/chitin deacetylase (PgdA/CDA1 family)